MRVALTCIAKDEDNYIEEWVEYNLKLGFDDIFIYQNDWRCLLDNHRVQKINFDGSGVQVSAYNNFIQSYYKKYDWVAFFDVDEFLVLKKHNNVKDFISEYKDADAIGINWVFFGDNGLSFNGEYSVLKRFTKRSRVPSPSVKCIVKVDPTINFMVHNPINRMTTDTHYNKFWGVTNDAKKIDIAQLNHYFSKTWEEWQQKRNRGKADVVSGSMDHIRSDSDFHRGNVNEVEDMSALNFYLGKTNVNKKSDIVTQYRRLKGGDVFFIKN